MYSNSQGIWSNHEPPPLATLQPPRNVGVRIHLDDDFQKIMEVARKVYAVRDCFRNIVQVAFGVAAKKYHCDDGEGIPTLGAMCSMVIGTSIQAEFDDNIVAKGEDNDGYMEDDEVMELVNDIYEAVPTHYRR
jgi:hypothetical protein